MNELHAVFESVRELPPNVTRLVQVGGNWFALRYQDERIAVRLVRRGQ